MGGEGVGEGRCTMETEPLLRHRIGAAVHGRVASADVGVKQADCGPSAFPRRRKNIDLGRLPCVGFIATYLLFVLVGIACTLLPPQVRTRVAGEEVPTDAMCYRVIRKADYVSVEYAIGAPTRRVQVLLRLDRVVEGLEHSVRIFSERLVESKSLVCDASNGTCYDTILVTQGEPNKPLALVGLQFTYTNPTKEYDRSDVTRYYLDLDGEMYAARGYRYWLSNTHLCVSRDATATPADTASALVGEVVPHTDAYGETWQKLQTNISSLAAMPTALFGHAATYQAYHGSECIGGLDAIDLLPYQGGSDRLYLAIADSSLYESEPEQVRTRRQIVELGYVCAGSLARFEREFNLYDFDCNNAPYFDYCRQDPSLPYRRMSTYDVRVHYLSDGTAYFWFERDPTLDSLPGLANSVEAVWLATIKLGTLILAAAVMWVRSDRSTSSSHWLYKHCVRVANCQLQEKTAAERKAEASSVIEDALLGLVAVGARIGVAAWRMGALQSENQSRVCYAELIAGIVSLVSWFTRFFVIEPGLFRLVQGASDKRGPLARLGGSMAITDASCAVLMAFAEPPIHLSAVSRFDDTARLLVGLVIALVTFHRCLFAVACNSIVLEAHRVGLLTSGSDYKLLVVFALVGWLTQTTVLAIGLADLVASPMAFTLTRGVVGDDVIVGVACFMALVTVSLPRLMHTSVKLVEIPP